MADLTGKYIESFYPERFKTNLLAKRMVETGYYTVMEAEAILKKYHIGTATDGNPAYWLYNKNLELKSVKVKSSVFFGIDGMWNLPTVFSNEPFRRIGIASTPEDAFWANMYMRDIACWIHIPEPPHTDIAFLQGLDAFAILQPHDPIEKQIRMIMPYANIIYEQSLKEKLISSGKPTPFVIPPHIKPFEYQQQLSQYRDTVIRNQPLANLIKGLNLTFQ